jgi:hypothetical protein
MSGPSDLARLSDTIDRANELLLSDEIKIMDVGGGVMRPTNAKVLADLSVQMSGARIYLTTAEGLAGTIAGGFFSVLSVTAAGYVDLYQNVAGVADFKKRYPSTEAVAAIENIIRSTEEPEDYLRITDEEGGIRMSASAVRLKTEFCEIGTGNGFGIIDNEGGMAIYADAEKAYLGPLEVRYMDYPAVLVCNENGEIISGLGGTESISVRPLESALMFGSVIAVAEGSPSNIYPSAMLSRREDDHLLTSGLFSLTTVASDSGRTLAISDQYGPDAVLTLRQDGSSDARATLPLTIKVAPKQVTPRPLTVLFVGDSIGNNQGALFLKEYLEALNYAPNFIGTVHGAAITSRYDPNGPLGECRSGWQLGDYTFSKSDRALIVQPSAEAAYLAMTKEDQLKYNPFLRAAVVGDAPEVVRNGYVFDVAFYQARFGLATPEIVINALGTNDATSLPAEGFYSLCLANDTLFNRQVSAAWPNAKIIRTVPGTAIDPVRSSIWSGMYTHLIRAMKDAAALNNKVQVAPLWAMMNPDVGFPVPEVQPGSDGFLRGTWFDPVHPGGASRREYYKAMAPFVAVAALNL